MTIKNIKREVLLMKCAGESWQHRRHRTGGKVLKAENGIQKRQILQEIIEDEHDNDLLELSSPEMCPECGSKATWNNSSGELQCDNCGYSETE